jgi:hypothetical protein
MMARKSTPPKKDFIAYKGPGKLQITPQTPRGWRHFALWMVVILSPTVPFVLLSAQVDDTPDEHWALWGMIPVFLVMGLLIWRMAKWMLARSEIIDIADITEWKRDRDSNRRQS